jgi:hypothetical protein
MEYAKGRHVARGVLFELTLFAEVAPKLDVMGMKPRPCRAMRKRALIAIPIEDGVPTPALGKIGRRRQ